MKTKQTVPPNLCQFPFADGRSCRLPKSPTHEYLCLFHADRERRLLDQQALDAGDVSDLFGPRGELRTSTDVNAYLTRIASTPSQAASPRTFSPALSMLPPSSSKPFLASRVKPISPSAPTVASPNSVASSPSAR